jgi:hypothetical protein
MGTQTADVAGDRAGSGSVGRGIDARFVLGGLILLVAILRYLPLRGNGWFLDDNLYLILAHANGFTLSWLFNNVFEHFGILYRFSFNVLVHLMPISWRWLLLVDLIMLAASVFLLDRCLRMLLDSTWAPLLLAAAFGLSVLLIEALQWVSSGLQNFPTALGDLLCLYGYLRYLDHPSRRWILLSAAGLAFGLLFFEKGAFMIGYLPLIRILFLAKSLSWRDLRRAAVAEREFWAALIVVLILWVIGLKISHAGGMFINPSVSEWLTYWRIMWGQTLVPAVFGLHLPWYGVTHREVVEGIGLEVVTAVAIVVSIWRKRIAWRAWAALVVIVLANGILVAEERIVVLQGSASIAGDTRYLLDFSWLVPLLLAFAFSPAQRFWPQARRLTVKLTLPAPGRPRLVALGVLLLAVGYVLASQVNTVALQNGWLGHDALTYEQNLQNGVRANTHNGVEPVIADLETPYEVMGSIYPPYNHISYIAPFYVPRAHVDGPLTGPLVVADVLGDIQPSVTHVQETFDYPRHRCEAASASVGLTMLNQIKIRRPDSAGPFYLLVKYGRTNAPYLQYFGTVKDPPAGNDQYIDLANGVGSSIGYMGTSLPTQLFTHIPGHSTVCLHSLAIVTLSVG